MKARSIVEFAELTLPAAEFLAIGSYGFAETGKTQFACTMPDPIGVIPLDRKTRYRLQRANEKYHKTLFFPKDDFIRHKDPLLVANMKPEEAMAYYADHVSRIQDAIYTLAGRDDVRSVVIDPGTALYEDMMFKHFGRAYRVRPTDRAPLNADMRDLFNTLQSKHLLITHQATEVWKADKPTGRFEWAGWNKLDYYCNVILEHAFDEKSHDFSVTVRLAQDRPDLIGETILHNEDITFDMLEAVLEPVMNGNE